MTLTPAQRIVLREVEQGQVRGICSRYVWKFDIAHTGELVTRHVNALMKKELVEASYFNGGRAAVNITEYGRNYLKEWPV
jgi:hypothetical protein